MSSYSLFNPAALTAVQNLSTIQSALNVTQSQISSGLRVQTASDNPAYWAMSNSMDSDVGALSAVSSSLDLGASITSTATTAVTSALTLLNKMMQDVVAAGQTGVSTSAYQADIAAQQQGLIAILGSASFNGVNLLDGSQGSAASFVSSFTRTASGGTTTTSVQTMSIPTGGTSGTQIVGSNGILAQSLGAFSGAGVAGSTGAGAGANSYAAGSILAINITNATSSDLTKIQAGINTMINEVNNAGTLVGNASTVITNQQTYVSALSDAIQTGIGSLVDADMNAASTRLQALQTQQQLAIQALAIANQNSQLILKLFGD